MPANPAKTPKNTPGHVRPTLTPPVPLPPLDLTKPRTAIVDLAIWLIGQNIREVHGANRGPWVDLFLSNVNPALIGNPWCAAVQYWLHQQAGIPPTMTSPALAASWFAQTERLIYHRTKPITPSYPRDFQPGDIVGFEVNGADHINHVELVLENRKEIIITAGGNTSAAGAIGQIIRDGDGFYQKARRRSDIVAGADWITRAAVRN